MTEETSTAMVTTPGETSLTRTNSMRGRSKTRDGSQNRAGSLSRTNSMGGGDRRWNSSSRPLESLVNSPLDEKYVTKKESFREAKRKQSHLNMTKKETDDAEHKKEAYAEMRALIAELADFEAQVRALKDKHVEESVSSNNKCMTEAEINEKEKKKDLIDSKVEKFNSIIAELERRSEELRIASEIPSDVIKALTNLDRRELLEITKLQQPPALMKQALNFIMTFLEFYGVKDKESGKPTSPGAISLDLEEEDFDTKFDRERTWTEIRKFMGIDMRNQMIPLTTDIILQDEDLLQKFRYKMHSTMDAKQVAKNTGKPTAALFNFIAHLFDCSFAIIERRELVKNIEKFKIEFTKPTLTSNDLFTEMRALIGKLYAYEEAMKELNNKIDQDTKFFEELRVEKKDLKMEKEKLSEENESLKETLSKLASEVSETSKEKQELDNKINNHDTILEQMKQLSKDLLLGSEIRSEVSDALVNFDRNELMVISKLVAPPALMQLALEKVMLFADLFFDKTIEEYAKLEEQEQAELAARGNGSPVGKKPKGKDGKSGSFRGGVHLTSREVELKKLFDKERNWGDIRKFMSNDIRPALTDLSPEVIARDKYSVKKLLDSFQALDQSNVTKNSTSAGVVFDYCKAMLECAHCIQQRNENEVNIKNFTLDLLNEEFSRVESKLQALEEEHRAKKDELSENENQIKANEENDEKTIASSEETKKRIEDMKQEIQDINTKREKPLNDLSKVTERVMAKLDKNFKDKNQSLLNIKNLNFKLDPILDMYDDLSANIIYLDKREQEYIAGTELPPKYIHK